MEISLIAAFDENRVIGKNNALPWNMPADLKHFKNITMGHYIIMGRKTYESVGTPLPGRTSIIITRQSDYKVEGAIVCASLNEALEKSVGEEEVFIIGGAQIFKEAIKIATRIYTTVIHHAFEGDAYFTQIDDNKWKITSVENFPADEKNLWSYSYINYEKK